MKTLTKAKVESLFLIRFTAMDGLKSADNVIRLMPVFLMEYAAKRKLNHTHYRA